MSITSEILNENLSNIVNSSMRKRLIREINLLCDKKDIIFMDVDINDENNDYNTRYYPYSVKLYEPSKDRIYDILLSNNYPFAPPKLNINYKPYSHYFKFSSIEFKESLYKYKKIRCFCCKTILCGDNWSPCLTICDIINEVHNFENYCKEISHRVIIDVIKRKYLISDINLVEWLY